MENCQSFIHQNKTSSERQRQKEQEKEKNINLRKGDRGEGKSV